MRWLMVAILVVALSVTIAQRMLDANEDMGVLFVILPMSNILILVAPGVRNGKTTKPFWIGFEAAGISTRRRRWRRTIDNHLRLAMRPGAPIRRVASK